MQDKFSQWQLSVNGILAYSGIPKNVIELILSGETSDAITIDTLGKYAYELEIEMKTRFKNIIPTIVSIG